MDVLCLSRVISSSILPLLFPRSAAFGRPHFSVGHSVLHSCNPFPFLVLCLPFPMYAKDWARAYNVLASAGVMSSWITSSCFVHGPRPRSMQALPLSVKTYRSQTWPDSRRLYRKVGTQKASLIYTYNGGWPWVTLPSVIPLGIYMLGNNLDHGIWEYEGHALSLFQERIASQ